MMEFAERSSAQALKAWAAGQKQPPQHRDLFINDLGRALVFSYVALNNLRPVLPLMNAYGKIFWRFLKGNEEFLELRWNQYQALKDLAKLRQEKAQTRAGADPRSEPSFTSTSEPAAQAPPGGAEQSVPGTTHDREASDAPKTS